MNYLLLLLIFIPVSIVLRYLNVSLELVFVLTCLGIVPLASLLGEATEEIAARTNARLGGLLNATLGNAAELIIAVFAIRAGLLDLVLASITGSILGNVLLIMGLGLLLGGLRLHACTCGQEFIGQEETVVRHGVDLPRMPLY